MSRYGAAAGGVALAFAALCAGFVRQEGLGTFADDSVSYLVMAQVFSPWQEASPAVMAAFASEAFHPPLFPLLLGWAGAAFDFERAHALNALLAAGCIALTYVVAARWTHRPAIALAAAVALALMPVMWVETRGILSEPLFCLLLLATLVTLEEPPARRKEILLAALFSGLCLTRTAGIPVVLAYAAWAALSPGSVRERLWKTAPALAALGAYAAWLAFRPEAVVDVNSGTAIDRLRAIAASAEPVHVLFGGIVRQAQAMAEAWLGAVLLFWVEGQALRPALAAVVGLLALAGMTLRLASRCADAWMIAAYLALYLLWPFYDQMTRFLFPIVPLVVLYAFVALAAAAQRLARPPDAAAVLGALLIASLAAPGLAFIHQRFRMEGPERDIVDWYRTPDLAVARARAGVHLGLGADMDAIQRLTAPHERVMWVAPAYVALLAGRTGLPAPDARLTPAMYRAAVARAAPDAVLLTAYHPRDTIRDDAWRVGVAALSGAGTVIHARRAPAGNRGASFLVRLDR